MTPTSDYYRCNLCGFSVPADEIGVAIMREHLKVAHDRYHDPLCIVCPHPSSSHYEVEGDYGQCWCRQCNVGPDMAGPCSDYFRRRHDFEPSSPEHRGPHGTLWAKDCRWCGLGAEDMAHDLGQ